jgi:hypothetical protein
MADLSMPCRVATPETDLQLFPGWPAHRMGGLHERIFQTFYFLSISWSTASKIVRKLKFFTECNNGDENDKEWCFVALLLQKEIVSKSLNKRPWVCKIEWGIWKEMFKNSTITPSLPFKQQQNIALSFFFPPSLEKWVQHHHKRACSGRVFWWSGSLCLHKRTPHIRSDPSSFLKKVPVF